jgi:glycosyltransferase involved in cell wall biosynthesis
LTASRVRVLWLVKGLAPNGAERLLLQAAESIDRSRFDLEIAYTMSWNDALLDDMRKRDVITHDLGDGRSKRVGPRPSGLGWILRLRRLVVSRGYDIVHTHMPLPAAVARIVLRPPFLDHQPLALVHTEHNVWPSYRRSTRLANALTYSRNQAVIAVSQSVARSVAPPWPASRATVPPIEVVIHGIDRNRFDDSPSARALGRQLLGVDGSAEVIGTVARLTPNKDQATLLRAFARVAPQRPAARLVIVGEGPLRPALDSLAAELGIADRVRFLGARDDVPAIFPGFDVFAVTSRYEGLALVLLEAMASGVPIVGTAIDGITDIVTDGETGLLRTPGDDRGVATAIERILEQPGLADQLRRSAAVRIDSIDSRAATRRIERVYEQVLGRAAVQAG